MKKFFIPILLVVICCQNKKSAFDGISKLCNCQNSKGKTIEIRNKEVLGNEFYNKANSIEAFSEALKADANKSVILEKTLESEFINDAVYKKCATISLKDIDFEQPLSKIEEEKIINFFNAKKEFTVYQVLPSLIVHFKQGD